jgi:hypothetical protein
VEREERQWQQTAALLERFFAAKASS